MTSHPDSLRFWLRETTRPLHEAVDRTFAGYALGERNGYGAFLRAHAAALLPIEAWLDAAGVTAVLPDWPSRTRAGALRTDLATLGVAVPAAVPWQVAPAPEAVWGVLYVLEGSRMGARYLARQVPQDAPAGYLRHGEGVPLWPAFVQCLEEGGASLERAGLAAGAHAAFDAFLAAGRQHTPVQA